MNGIREGVNGIREGVNGIREGLNGVREGYTYLRDYLRDHTVDEIMRENIRMICQINTEIDRRIAKSDYPYAYSILKQSLIKKILSGESFLNATKVVIISDSLNKLIVNTTNYLTEDFLRDHPTINDYVNCFPIKQIITGSKDCIINNIAVKIMKKI
jgi:hypothetical protein